MARLVAEAGTLRDILPRLAGTRRPSIRSERLHVLWLDRAESFVLYVVRETGALEIREHRVGDPPTSIEAGDPDAISRILCTVRQGTRVHGAVWLTSSVEDAFDASHQSLMDSVVDVLGLAFEHTAIIDRETLRRERIDSLRGLSIQWPRRSISVTSSKRYRTSRGGLPTTSGDHRVGKDGARSVSTRWRGTETDAELLEPQVLTGDDRTASIATPTSSTTPTPSSRRTALAAYLQALRRRSDPRPVCRCRSGPRVFGSLFFPVTLDGFLR